MAIIVEDTRTGGKGILLGSGMGLSVHNDPTLMGTPRATTNQVERLAVCDKEGRVTWLEMAYARVVLVDGDRPQDVLIDD